MTPWFFAELEDGTIFMYRSVNKDPNWNAKAWGKHLNMKLKQDKYKTCFDFCPTPINKMRQWWCED